MLSTILSWLGGTFAQQIIGGALDAYKARLAAGTSHDALAADLAAKELALQQREIEVQSQYRIASLGRWYEPDKLMGYFVAAYLGKLLIWDKVLGLGATDGLGPADGFLAVAANLIVAFYFAKRGFENVARIIKK